MIQILLATGVFGSSDGPGEPSNVTTPPERTITFTRTGQPNVPQQVLDPKEVMDFVLNLTPLLASGEEFTDISLTTTTDSAALGFMIMGGEWAREQVTQSQVRIWVTVMEEYRNSPAWNSGSLGRFEVIANTNSIPPRTWRRTCGISGRSR